MPRGKKATSFEDVISLLNQSKKSSDNLSAIAKQVSIIEKATKELNRLLAGDDSSEDETAAPAAEKPAYTGKPRGRKPKALGEAA
jgi:hypothetical protein